MAPMLLQKLFNKKAAATIGGAIECPTDAEIRWASAEFELAQIRLIVYQDCERRGRQVLFDSKAIQKLDPSELNVDETKAPPTRSGACQIGCKAKPKETPPTYQYSRPSSDVSMLGEMMFGSVAMSYKGSTLKIHHIRSPPQLMVSKVFSARCGSSNTGSTNTLQDSLESISQTCPTHHSSSSSSIAHSNPVDMPGRGHSEDSDSGIARSASLSSLLATPLPSPGSSYSSGCASSYQRRWFRSQATSLQHGLVHRWSTDEMFSLSDESSCSSNPGLGRRKKIGVSIIISLPEKDEENQSFQEFFFSHFPLFESHMNKLKTAIERAMIVCRRVAEPSQRVQVYLCRVMEALGEFRMTVWNLYMAPRITDPVWLTMVSQSAERNQLCQHFLKEMSLLMEHGAKNQFLSSLLTAVLMYHLAWVPTVMPSDHPPIKAFYQKHSSHTVDLLAKCHSYNPLWAQLGDLYGALGSPVRVCRTVVVGRRRELVQRVLYVLSYFIRCAGLQENTLPQAQTDSPANPCPSQTNNPAPCSERPNERPLTCDSDAANSTRNPDGTNEKLLAAVTNSADPTSCSGATSTEAGHSESSDFSPLPETTNERLEGAQDCSGKTTLEHTWANPSPPVHRVRFMIGSPKEVEFDRQCQNRTGPRCGRGLHRKIPSRLLTDSLDSSDEEELSHRLTCTESEMQQHELPLPSCDVESRPDVNHFGRSLLGGYSPQYMPDFVLHGVTSDHRLKQCLMADLEHTVLHPALDEPIAEAVCIVADTDRLCVQVATTQRRVCEPGQIGRDVMVSNLVHTILTSVLQLHALNMAAEFCVMHLEDRLQEVYFKSCSLAEYLRGQRRVHVKELGLALGIESSDLPLVTAVASTHSPYVAQILL